MKIVIAPDSFKGVLTAPDAAAAIASGVAKFLDETGNLEGEIILTPIADGGEGTAAALAAANNAEEVMCDSVSPDGTPVRAGYYFSQATLTAYIDQAAAGGLPLVPQSRRNPLRLSSFGTGLLIADALRRGAMNVIIGIGGSATIDGGIGALQALGAKFLDEYGISADIPATAAHLDKVGRIDTETLRLRIAGRRIVTAVDVDSPLTGERGAAAVFGPQKGASPEDVVRLDNSLRRFACMAEMTERPRFALRPGSGAGGGLAYGLAAIAGAELVSGSRLILEQTGLAYKLKDADILITGEGSCDRQTLMHKAPFEAMTLARKTGVPAFVLAGKTADEDALLNSGFSGVININEGYGPGDGDPLAPSVAASRLAAAAYRLMCSLLRKV